MKFSGMQAMNDRQRLLFLILILAVVVSFATGTTSYLLYETAFTEQRKRLIETAKTHARLIEAVARFDAQESTDYPGGAAEATISQIRDAHEKYESSGETEEFTLARREGDRIVYLFRQRHQELDTPKPVLFDSGLAEPMRQALLGRSGTLVGLDYRGETVLSAYKPVAVLNLGIVIKIDLAEIRAPFIKTGIITGVLALFAIVAGAFLFAKTTNPMIIKLQEGRENYQRLFDTMLDGYATHEIICDEEGKPIDYKFLEINNAFQELTGLGNDIVGKTVLEVIPNLEPYWINTYGKVALTGESVRFENYSQGVGDKWFDVVAFSAIDRQFTVVFREVTAKKKAEEELRASQQLLQTVFDTVPSQIFVKDQNGRYLIANRMFSEFFGLQPEQIIAKTFGDIYQYGGESVVDSDNSDRIVLEKGQVMTTNEIAVRNHRGETRILTRIKLPITDERGSTAGIVGIHEDITDRKRAEEELSRHREHLEELVAERTKELQEAQEQLVRKEKLAVLGQLAGGVGHELRNPLGAIKNAAYFLNMAWENPDPEVKETLEILNVEVTTSERIIESLLDFARPTPSTRQKVDINDVVQRALDRAGLPGTIETVTRLDEALPAILTDPGQVSQIFGNIILNAIQAMPDGGRLEVKSEVQAGGWVTVSFSDTGAGIPEENLAKLFEPLFTTKPKGIGLGLALSQTLAEGQGGAIEVKSEAGKGSTFTVRLPAGSEEQKTHG